MTAEQTIYFSYEYCDITDKYESRDVEEPLTLMISYFSVKSCSSIHKTLTLSDASPAPDASVTFCVSDFSSIQDFYKALHSKAPGTPAHSHFFVFARKTIPNIQWDGFICDETHLNYIAEHKSNLIVAIFYPQTFDRAIRNKKGLTISESLLNAMEPTPEGLTPAERAYQRRSKSLLEKRGLVYEQANSPSIVDMPVSKPEAPVLSSIIVDQSGPKIPIAVYKEYANLLQGIDAICYCIDVHLNPRQRTTKVNEEIVYTIVREILERHAAALRDEMENSESNGSDVEARQRSDIDDYSDSIE